MARQAGGEGAQAPHHLIGVLGGHRPAEVPDGVVQALGEDGIAGGGAAHEDVGMAADIFGQGLDRQIDAVVEWLEIEAGGPGVVHQGEDAALPGQASDGRGVLHVEGQGAWRLKHDQAGGRAGHGDEIVGRGRWLVVANGHAEPREHPIAEPSGGIVGRVGDENLVAGLEHAQHGAGEGGEARGEEADRCGVFQLGQGGGKQVLDTQAAPAIGDRVVVVEFGGLGHEHRRALFDGRSDGASARPRAAAGVNQLGGLAECFVRRGQAPVATGVSVRAPHSLQEPS